MQGIFAKPILLAQGREGGLAFLLVGAWDGSCSLAGWIRPHAAQTLLTFGKDRIVELPRCFQVCPEAFGLPCFHDKGQLEQKGGRLALFCHQVHILRWGVAGTSIPSIAALTASVKRDQMPVHAVWPPVQDSLLIRPRIFSPRLWASLITWSYCCNAVNPLHPLLVQSL